MALPFRVDRKNALPFLGFALQEAGRLLWDPLRGAPRRLSRTRARMCDPVIRTRCSPPCACACACAGTLID
jgi:hypothetical protein